MNHKSLQKYGGFFEYFLYLFAHKKYYFYKTPKAVPQNISINSLN